MPLHEAATIGPGVIWFPFDGHDALFRRFVPFEEVGDGVMVCLYRDSEEVYISGKESWSTGCSMEAYLSFLRRTRGLEGWRTTLDNDWQAHPTPRGVRALLAFLFADASPEQMQPQTTAPSFSHHDITPV